MKKQSFFILKREGKEEKQGFVFGDFAIHQEARGYWVITHIPSGLAIYGTYHFSKIEAMKIAQQLNDQPVRPGYDENRPERWGTKYYPTPEFVAVTKNFLAEFTS